MTNPAGPGEGGFVAAPRHDLCLDFANTLSWRGTTPPTDELHGLEGLLAWAGATGGADPGLIRRGRTRWSGKAAEQRAFAEAIGLRETIYRLFAAIGDGAVPPGADVAALNAALQAAPARFRLGVIEGRCVWRLAKTTPVIPALLAPVLWSAGDLLAGPLLARVRSCANERCRWLFLDDSKSGNRRWCSMSACGNRAKAHRHYIKRRQDK